jgi:hypothetical protein
MRGVERGETRERGGEVGDEREGERTTPGEGTIQERGRKD